MHTDRCGDTRRQKCCAKVNGEGNKIREFMYRDKSMRNTKCVFISVITGAMGIVTEGLQKNFEAIPGKQKTFNVFTTTSALLGTSHVKREELQSETGNLKVGDRRRFRINTWKERSAAAAAAVAAAAVAAAAAAAAVVVHLTSESGMKVEQN